jgi:hypothetical protein
MFTATANLTLLCTVTGSFPRPLVRCEYVGAAARYLQPEECTAPWLNYPPGSLLNEISTTGNKLPGDGLRVS